MDSNSTQNLESDSDLSQNLELDSPHQPETMESYSDPSSQNFVLDPYQPQNLESDDSNPSQDLKPVFNPPQNVEWDFKPSPLDPLPNIPDSEFQESQISEFKLEAHSYTQKNMKVRLQPVPYFPN